MSFLIAKLDGVCLVVFHDETQSVRCEWDWVGVVIPEVTAPVGTIPPFDAVTDREPAS